MQVMAQRQGSPIVEFNTASQGSYMGRVYIVSCGTCDEAGARSEVFQVLGVPQRRFAPHGRFRAYLGHVSSLSGGVRAGGLSKSAFLWLVLFLFHCRARCPRHRLSRHKIRVPIVQSRSTTPLKAAKTIALIQALWLSRQRFPGLFLMASLHSSLSLCGPPLIVEGVTNSSKRPRETGR